MLRNTVKKKSLFMIGNYFKTAFRNLLKNKSVSFINIAGLAIGLAGCITILAYIGYELSFDRFHANAGRIYRGVVKVTSESEWETTPQMVAAVGPSLTEDFPEIEKTVRFREPEDRYLAYDNRSYFVENVLYSDSTLFDLFSFRLLQGNPGQALEAPFSVVLSEQTARKIFGTENALGKSVLLDNKELLTVTGIIEDAPGNSHIQYKAFISFSSLYQDKSMHLDWNGGWAYYTYLLVSPGTDVEALAEKFQPFFDRHINYMFEGTSISQNMYLQPLTGIYLHSGLNGEIGPTGNLSYLIVFSLIALLIFTIACINYINLTATRLTVRQRETGIRKLLGATKKGIIMQFLVESVILNVIALILAFILAKAVLPVVSNLTGHELHLYQPSFLPYTLAVLLVILAAGVFAGCYPALQLSAQNAVRLARQAGSAISRRTGVRNITVVLQYTVSIAMIICSIFLYKQLSYIRHNDPGFDKNNILLVPMKTDSIYRRHEVMKAEFMNISAIEYITACYDYPGSGYTANGYIPEGYDEAILIHILYTDEDFVPMMGLKVTAGRNFSKYMGTDRSKYLINETFARSMGWKDPLGKTIERNGKHEVIGVVSDYNFATLHEPIAPLIISLQREGRFHYFMIRVKEGQANNVIEQLSMKWEQINPEIPFEYSFLEDINETGYMIEKRQATLILLFTFLAILIAFMGLYALTSYETERQTKNIGIRKINGASALEILVMLLGRFIRWVFISFLIACPVAYYAMTRWLQHFAYKTNMSWWVFVVAGITALLVAFLTVSWQTIHAAMRNPADAIRYE
jgi:putative ABC transport system permease protein